MFHHDHHAHLLFRSVCLSYLLLFSFHFYPDTDLNLFLHVVVAKAITHWHSANRGVWPSWQDTLLPQVMGQSSLTTSTTQRLLKRSSRRNPATKIRSPRTCVTRNSTMRPSAEHSLHHCSFRSEKNQRTENKLITLMKKVCCQLSPFLCDTQERGDPVHELRSLSSCSREKPSRDSEIERIRILLETQKSKFSLLSEQRFINTSFKPILIGEVFRN